MGSSPAPFSFDEMHARVVLGVGKGVLFREVSSVQDYLYKEGVPTTSEWLYLREKVCVCVCVLFLSVFLFVTCSFIIYIPDLCCGCLKCVPLVNSGSVCVMCL